MIENPPPQHLQQPQQQPAGPLSVRVTNGFSLGFFAFLGAFVASLLFWVIALVLLVVFGSIAAGVLHGVTATPTP
jgi:hypothetical protein